MDVTRWPWVTIASCVVVGVFVIEEARRKLEILGDTTSSLVRLWREMIVDAPVDPDGRHTTASAAQE
jgi:hypothetical protein